MVRVPDSFCKKQREVFQDKPIEVYEAVEVSVKGFGVTQRRPAESAKESMRVHWKPSVTEWQRKEWGLAETAEAAFTAANGAGLEIGDFVACGEKWYVVVSLTHYDSHVTAGCRNEAIYEG